MRVGIRNLLLLATAGLLLVLLPAYLLTVEPSSAATDPLEVVTKYLKASYARDFKQAYRFISTQDQRLKKEKVYVRERGPFSGFTSEVAWKLAEAIEARPLKTEFDGNRVRIKLGVILPDANSLSALLMNWDEDKLNSLPPSEQRKILASLERLKRDREIRTIEGEEEFVMAKEGSSWRLFLDWASGVRLRFSAAVPSKGLMEATAVTPETRIRPNELFTITYKVKNRSGNDLFAHIVHHVEPKSLTHYLDIVECSLLLPVRLLPGEQDEYSTTYLLRGDLPEGTKELNVTYEFKAER